MVLGRLSFDTGTPRSTFVIVSFLFLGPFFRTLQGWVQHRFFLDLHYIQVFGYTLTTALLDPSLQSAPPLPFPVVPRAR